ncbi:MAG: NCS2 family permease [Candidatus Ancaeobacter aquaticus]|nr:NCS2 family permease [Candidatus Ancaeobacter aquaticus]
MKKLVTFFRLHENNTTISREIIAGATTFMTLSYIIFVQPAVLSSCGMDFGAVMMATCIGSALATFLMGFLANYPIALAPAMGHNFYFAFVVCGIMKIPWQIALAANFVSGILLLILTLFKFREKLINAIPQCLKDGIAVGIGLLITLVGLEWAGIVVAHKGTLIGLGDLNNNYVLLSLFGLLLISILHALKIKGAILWGILITAILGIITKTVLFQGVFSAPPSIAPTLFKFDFSGLFAWNMISVIFVLFFLDLFDTIGTLIGIGEQGGFIKNGKFPRAGRALMSDAIGTTAGTVLGTSTITCYIESAAGVSAGGRTGLANMVTGTLMLCAIFLYPLAKMFGGGIETSPGTYVYPVIAPALIFIGSMMIKSIRNINWDDTTESIPTFLTMIIMPFAFGITEGIAFGFISYALLKLVTGKGKEVHWIVYLFAFLFVLRYIYLTQ